MGRAQDLYYRRMMAQRGEDPRGPLAELPITWPTESPLRTSVRSATKAYAERAAEARKRQQDIEDELLKHQNAVALAEATAQAQGKEQRETERVRGTETRATEAARPKEPKAAGGYRYEYDPNAVGQYREIGPERFRPPATIIPYGERITPLDREEARRKTIADVTVHLSKFYGTRAARRGEYMKDESGAYVRDATGNYVPLSVGQITAKGVEDLDPAVQRLIGEGMSALGEAGGGMLSAEMAQRYIDAAYDREKRELAKVAEPGGHADVDLENVYRGLSSYTPPAGMLPSRPAASPLDFSGMTARQGSQFDAEYQDAITAGYTPEQIDEFQRGGRE